MSTFRLPHFPHDRGHGAQAFFWAACGAIVLLYIFLAALGAFEPGEAEVVTAAVLVLAALWLGHSWGRLWRDEHGQRG